MASVLGLNTPGVQTGLSTNLGGDSFDNVL